jgi:beta-galactosidase
VSFDATRIAAPQYFAENRLAAHSDHRWFGSAEEARSGRSRYEQELGGLWKFHYAKNPGATIAGFEQPDFDTSSWDDIPVPAHIQLQGYDRPQYVNVQHPWDGFEQIEPGEVPTRFNPVGSYVRRFTLDNDLGDGERLAVCFNGAESAIAVWLNGRYIGYAADSFTPSEFDLTEHVRTGENVLAAQVFRFTSGSWIEDQDFFRFSGLFRNVVLRRRPRAHVEDVRVRTELSDAFDSAEVTVEVALQGEGEVRASISGEGPLTRRPDGVFAVSIAEPRLWSPESPHLYDLAIEVLDPSGEVLEVISQRVGIRRFELHDGVLQLNGARVVFKGVNRHEFGRNGRVVSRDETEADIKLLKRFGVNAVRTSHYPNSSHFYELCDEYGLLVMDEMNLESHALWDRVVQGVWTPEQALPGDRPEWQDVLLDRAASMLQRDKNHASVVMWSCGNESFSGSTILAVSDYFRTNDSRPVHYEGVSRDQRYLETTDVVSTMYTPADEVERWLGENRDKPYILCEYAHAMGNSFGAVHKYVDLAYREPLFQGGFIWDFADQALPLRDRFGREYLGYGGSFGDAPNDGDFSGNGIVFADRTPKPLVQELRHLYQGLAIDIDRDAFTVENRFLATNADAYECVMTLSHEGVELRREATRVAAAPGTTAVVSLPFPVPTLPGDVAVDVSFRLDGATAWAEAGYEVASAQRVFERSRSRRATRPGPEVIDGIHNVGVRGEHFTALFSRLMGGLTSYRYGTSGDGGHELLTAMPMPSFWHAPTSNERGWGMPALDAQWLIASRYATPRLGLEFPEVRRLDHSAEIRFTYDLPTTPAGEADVTYEVFADGLIEVTVRVRPGEGLTDPPEFAMQFVTSADLHRLRYFGEGPEECYVDRRLGARLGIYEGEVADHLPPYLRPQESGSRTGVRWAEVRDDRGRGLRFIGDPSMEFSALPWTPDELESASYPIDLPPIHRTVLRPAFMRRGVGGDNSWGALTHPEYLLPTGPLEFRFAFHGIG